MPQLTGIRAVAFLMVFLFHAELLGRGFLLWSGVDLFFVLSGFLITGILLSQKKDQGYFKVFYIRRFLRILPPFYFILILIVLVFQQVRGDQVLATALFLANLYLPLASDPGSLPSYAALSPYWSLALEEQFYLIWPLLIFYISPRRMLWACVTLCVLAPLARTITLLAFANGDSFKAVHMLPINRVDLLAAGSLIALLRHLRFFDERVLSRIGAGLAGSSFTIIIALTVLRADFRASAGSIIFSSMGYSLVCAMMCGIILYLANTTTGLTVKLLSTRPMIYLGTISYTMYLVHEGVIQLLLGYGIPKGGISLTIAAFAITFAVAAFSWHLIEKPIKKFKDRNVGANAGITMVAPESLAKG